MERDDWEMFLQELVEQICRDKHVKFQHKVHIRGKQNDFTVYIYHDNRGEGVELSLYNYDGPDPFIRAVINDKKDRQIMQEDFPIEALNPEALEKYVFDNYANTIKQEKEKALKVLMDTDIVLKSIGDIKCC